MKCSRETSPKTTNQIKSKSQEPNKQTNKRHIDITIHPLEATIPLSQIRKEEKLEVNLKEGV